jgi:hypothetical protein
MEGVDLDGCWLNFFEPIQCCLLVFGDFAMKRFQMKCKALFKEVVACDGIVRMFVIMTSKKRVLCLNAFRCGVEDASQLRSLIIQSDRCENVVSLRPVYTDDLDKQESFLAYICTSLGYFRRPSCINNIVVPVCEGCWKSEIPQPLAAVAVPCMNPSHVVCSEECLKKCEYCPFEKCVLGTIKLSNLFIIPGQVQDAADVSEPLE